MAVITIPGMFLTGDHASRPAANTVGSGSIYSCTTHALIYQSDGSSWTTWATLGETGSAAHIADTTDAHDASAISFSPTGTIAATDVQAAIAEVASEAGASITVKAARVTRNADQSISSGGTAISWDNEVRDDGGFYSAGSPTRLTVPDTAWYIINATGNQGSGTADFLNGRIRLNGTTDIDFNRQHETTNSVSWSVQCGGAFYLTAADYVEFLLDVGATVSVHGQTAVPGYLNMSIAKIV